ncbi:MAG TPA: PHB depolymerase family esterase [Myxococcota bacterium]|nr:PHB depolymerase family esterase [Myxococcota bacterium]
MSRSAAAVLLVAVVLACRAHAPEPNVGGPALARGELAVGGRTRTYAFYRPGGAGPFPLVLALHGRFGDGQGQDRMSGFAKLGAAERFIVIYPDGFERSWNDLRHAGPAAEAGIDDVAYLTALVDSFVRERGADPARVYAVGLSNGGFMAQTLGCAESARLAAIGSVAATVSEGMVEHCRPTAALPVMLVLGTDDPLVPWRGGAIGQDRGSALSGEDSAAWWADTDGCRTPPERMELPDVDPRDGTRVSRALYAPCRDGVEVRLYAVEGGGHTWPRGWRYLGEWAVGRVSQDLDATEELWRFFQAHHR